MSVNSLMNDGQVQAYFSDAAMAEVTYQTSGVTADVSTGGVRINMIPKDGGNTFSGQAFVGGTDGDWQSVNVTDELRARGLSRGSRVAKIQDFNFGVGGPILKDKLWFFASWRRIATDSVIPGSFFREARPRSVPASRISGFRTRWSGSPGRSIRRTSSASTTTAIRSSKAHEAIVGYVAEWNTAAGRRDPEHALYYTGQAKWTSTITNRLLLEAGYSTNVEYLFIGYQPGIQKQRGTAEWFTTIGKEDLINLRAYDGRITPANGIDPKANTITGMLSYVTGSHAFKTGFNWTFGDYVLEYDINGDMVQRYRSGVPDSVRVYNTPVRANEYLNAQPRHVRPGCLDVEAGDDEPRRALRALRRPDQGPEHRRGPLCAGAHLQRGQTGMPSWFDVAPRLGVSYDLFGTGRTALKATFGKYMAGQTTGFPARYNPLQLQNDMRTWRDIDVVRARTAPQRAADERRQHRQANEIGPTNNAAFGLPVQTIRPDADFKREYDLEYTAQVQHEVIPRPVAHLRLLPPRHPQPAAHPEPRLVAVRLHRSSTWSARSTARSCRSTTSTRPSAPMSTGSTSTPPTPICAGAPTTASRPASTPASAASSSSAAGRWIGSSTSAATRSKATPAAMPAPPPICGTNNNPNPDYPLVRSEPARHAVAARVQGRRVLHPAVLRHPDQHRAAELQRPAAVHPLEHRPDHPLRRQLRRRRAGPGELVVPNMTLPNYVIDLVAPGQQFYARQNQLDLGFRKIFRIGQLPDLRPGGHLQRHQFGVREEPEHHLRHAGAGSGLQHLRPASRHPSAADAAAGGAAEVLRGLRPQPAIVTWEP